MSDVPKKCADTALLRAAWDVVRLHDEHIDPGMDGPYALAAHREAKHKSIERMKEALKHLDAEKVIVEDDDGTP